MAALIAGCGKGSGKEMAAKGDSSDDAAAEADSGAEAPAREPKAGKGKKQKSKGKYIGQIPIDAWPEIWLKDPLAIAAEKGAASGTPVSTPKDDGDPQVARKTESDPPPDKPTLTGDSPPPSGGSEWPTLISGDVMAAETKTIKNSLTDKLANKGRYDSTYKELRVDAAELTCLAGIAPEHPNAPNWKKDAKYVRDMASQIALGSTANGEKFFNKVRPSFDKLEELLAGSKPGGIEEAADKVPFSEVAPRNFLMIRMERAYNAMKANINTEAIFKKESEKVNHEASILAFLSTIIRSPGYNDADDDDYKKFAEQITKSSLEMEAAAKNQDYSAYTGALDRCYKACSDCHQNFKNN
jgi:hypothetical protein